MSWRSARLSEVAEIVSGATPKTSVGEYWNGEIPWATPADLSDLVGAFITDTPRKISELGLRSCASSILPVNSVLFSSRAPIGHVAVNTVPMATNQGFKSFVPDPKRLNAKFLYWWLKANRAQLEALGNGATFKEVSKATVSRVEIPLPPLEEQKRIAAILDQADELCAKRRKAIALLESLTQSIFVEMFGDPVSNPKALQYVPLADLVDPSDRLNYGVVQPGDNVEDGVPLIRVSDLQKGVVDRSNLRRIHPNVSTKHSRSVLKGTEILISCVGSIGEISLAREADKGSNIARAVARVPLKENISREFVATYLRTNSAQHYFTKELRTVSQPTLNIKQILETPVPLIGSHEAIKFENRLTSAQKLILKTEIFRKYSSDLFASLQHRAFSGQL